MASSIKTRGLSKGESATINYHLQQRKNPHTHPNGKPLPSKLWKPLFIRHMIEDLDKGAGDAERMWQDLMDRITSHIRDSGFVGTRKRKSDGTTAMGAHLVAFAQLPENREILEVFDEPTRKQFLESLEVNSRQRIRDGLKRGSPVEPNATTTSPVSVLDANHSRSISPCLPPTSRSPETLIDKDGATVPVPVIHTWGNGKKYGTIIDVNHLKIDCNLPASKDNLNFERYVRCLERQTDFKRHKDSLFWILPPLSRNTQGKHSRIIDGSDWSLAIDLQLCVGINHAQFEYLPADEAPNIDSLPLAITMNEAKRPRIQA